MAIYHLRLAPVKKAGTTIARSAHHGGHRLTTRGAVGKAAYLAGERLHGYDGQRSITGRRRTASSTAS